ncbi:MAG: FtsX-like permease family protein, partial [Acidobacteriota bacterium]
LPLAQQPAAFAWIVARTRDSPTAFSQPLRRAVLDLDPNLPLYNVYSMDQVLNRSLFGPRFFGTIFGAFGVAALFMACIGLYGLMAFAVSQRSQEMGVRMALGAKSRDILSMILRQGFRQTALGLAVGLVLGKGLAVVLASQLFQARSNDVVVFLAIPAILTVASLLACWSPARRAAGVDPNRALRRG